MNASSLENGIASSDNWSASDDRKQSPPAFLDLADSVCVVSSLGESALVPITLREWAFFTFFSVAGDDSHGVDANAVNL